MKNNIALGNVTVKTVMMPGDYAAKAVSGEFSNEGDRYLRVLDAIHSAIKDEREKIATMLERDGYYTLARNVREMS